MLTEDEVIADLARLRERSAGIEYDGPVPLTRRSAAATIVPVAAVAAVATLGATAVIGTDRDGGGTTTRSEPTASRDAGTHTGDEATASPGHTTLIDAEITLAGRTIAYRHAPGKDPFAPGWQLALVLGDTLPAGATELTVPDGSKVWVAAAPSSDLGKSMMIVRSGPDGSTGERHYVAMASRFSTSELEDWVRTELDGE